MAISKIITDTLLMASSLSAASAASGFPVSNLQLDRRDKPWRSSALASQYVDFDFNEVEPVNCIALVSHNLTVNGQFTVTAGTSAGDDSLMNETFDAWEPLWGYGEGGFGEHGFGGYLTEDEISTYFPAGSLRVAYFSAQVMTQYLRVSFDDGGNGDGYIEAGRIMPAAYFASSVGVSPGMANKPEDPSRVSYAGGGQKFKDVATKYRMASYFYPMNTTDETFNLWYAFLRQIGVGGDFVGDFLADVSHIAMRLHNSLYCHIPQNGIQEVNVGELAEGSIRLQVRESL